MISNKVTFQSKDGLKLVGVLTFPEGKSPFPMIVMCHGRASSKDSSSYSNLEKLLLPYKVASFRFDQRGQGESEGNFRDLTAGGIVKDTFSAIDYLYNKHSELINKDKLILYGTSLGGFTSVIVASEDKRVRYLVVRSGVFDFRQVYSKSHDVKAWEKEGYINIDSKYHNNEPLGYTFYEEGLSYDLTRLASKIDIPVFILQGTKDLSIIPDNSKKLDKYIGSNDKKLKFIEGADHQYVGKLDEMQQAIVDWIKEKVIT